MIFNIPIFESEYTNDKLLNDIARLNKQLNSMPYGISINKNKVDTNSNNDNFDLYFHASPTQFIKQNGGVCWDFVTYEAYYLNKYHPEIKWKAFYIQFDVDEDKPSHTILTFRYKGKVYYIESSFKAIAGFYRANNEEDILEYVMRSMSDFNGNFKRGELLKSDYCIYEYNPIDRRLYGSDVTGFMDYIYKYGKPIKYRYRNKPVNVDILENALYFYDESVTYFPIIKKSGYFHEVEVNGEPADDPTANEAGDTDYTADTEDNTGGDTPPTEDNTDDAPPADDGEGDDTGGGDEGGEDTDYTQMDDGGGGDDDMEGDGGGDAGGDDTGGGDDNTNTDGPTADDARGMEKDLFKDLTPDQLDMKHRELKNNFVELYDSTSNIIDRINDIPNDEDHMKSIAFVSSQLLNVRKMMGDYMSNIYSTKSYIENYMNYERFLAALDGINNILEEIAKDEDQSEEDKEGSSKNESVVVEFAAKTKLNDNFKAKGKKKLSSYKVVTITDKYIKDNKSEYSDLKHCWASDETHDSIAWEDEDGNMVALLSISFNFKDNRKWISMISVSPEYRGYGLSRQILDVATKKYKATALGVHKSNEIAHNLYKKYGFKDKETNGNMIYMYIN